MSGFQQGALILQPTSTPVVPDRFDARSISLTDGNFVVTDSLGNSSPFFSAIPTRKIEAYQHPTAVSAGATINVDLPLFKSYALLRIGLGQASRIRLYVNTASRSSDAARGILTDPPPNSGLVAEAVSQGEELIHVLPAVIGFNSSSPLSDVCFVSITNLETASVPLEFDLTVLQLEA